MGKRDLVGRSRFERHHHGLWVERILVRIGVKPDIHEARKAMDDGSLSFFGAAEIKHVDMTTGDRCRQRTAGKLGIVGSGSAMSGLPTRRWTSGGTWQTMPAMSSGTKPCLVISFPSASTNAVGQPPAGTACGTCSSICSIVQAGPERCPVPGSHCFSNKTK